MPLTIITFVLFTKWWIADVVDGTEGIMYGFPFIYWSPAFYTSMAVQYFIIELLVDFILYFAVILLIIYFFNKYIIEIKIKKLAANLLLLMAIILLSLEVFMASLPENLFFLRRDFDIIVKDSGFSYPFNTKDKKIFYDYHK